MQDWVVVADKCNALVSGETTISSASMSDFPCQMLRVLRSTFDLRVNFQELEVERSFVVQRIAAVSARIRSALERCERLSIDEVRVVEQILEDRQEQVNRLIIQTQQASNATTPVRIREPRAEDATSHESCVAKLRSIMAELEEGKNGINLLAPTIRDATSVTTSIRSTDNFNQETEAWDELSAVLDATLRLMSAVICFVSHALEVLTSTEEAPSKFMKRCIFFVDEA